MWTRFALLALLALPWVDQVKAGQPKTADYIVYVGTYTRTASKGIYACGFIPPTASSRRWD